MKAPENGSYWLTGLEGKARKIRLRVDAPILVGRGTYNHVVLDDARLSRQHSRLAPERDGCFLYDLNSVNGTWVNGIKVTRQLLAPNDLISFGPCLFRLEFVPSADASRTAVIRDVEEPTLSGIDKSSAPESVSQMVTAIESKDSGLLPARDLTQLEDAYENLGTLYAFMQAISKTIDRSELLHLISSKILEVYSSARYVSIYLRVPGERSAEQLRLAHLVGPSTPAEVPSLPAAVRQAVLERRTAMMTSRSLSATRGGSDMYAPMIDRVGATLGVIHVSTHDQGDTFSRDALELLKSMAAPAAIMLQNTRMHEESLVEDRFRHDLALAAQIQKSFLPREVIAVEGVELFAEYRAAYTVSGDFYDVFWVGTDRLAIFIGDISGKGISGALLMARISSELRVAALAHVDPVAVLTAMNSATLGRAQSDFFFTAIYLTFNVRTGDVVLANAGHPTPYWCRADGAVQPVTGGAACAVGILDDGGYTSTSFNLAHGDSLVLYTDGVVEAANATGVLYGNERLHASLFGASKRPNQIAESILRGVDRHAAGGPVNDDLTLFICQRSVGAAPTMQPRRRSSAFPAPFVPDEPPTRR